MPRQQMILASQREQMLANWKEHAATDKDDFKPVVKLFDPSGAATWLLSELKPEDPDIAFGLADLGMGHPEIGYVYLPELLAIKLPGGLYIERDEHFEAKKTLTEYADEARSAGRLDA